MYTTAHPTSDPCLSRDESVPNHLFHVLCHLLRAENRHSVSTRLRKQRSLPISWMDSSTHTIIKNTLPSSSCQHLRLNHYMGIYLLIRISIVTVQFG